MFSKKGLREGQFEGGYCGHCWGPGTDAPGTSQTHLSREQTPSSGTPQPRGGLVLVITPGLGCCPRQEEKVPPLVRDMDTVAAVCVTWSCPHSQAVTRGELRAVAQVPRAAWLHDVPAGASALGIHVCRGKRAAQNPRLVSVPHTPTRGLHLPAGKMSRLDQTRVYHLFKSKKPLFRKHH